MPLATVVIENVEESTRKIKEGGEKLVVPWFVGDFVGIAVQSFIFSLLCDYSLIEFSVGRLLNRCKVIPCSLSNFPIKTQANRNSFFGSDVHPHGDCCRCYHRKLRQDKKLKALSGYLISGQWAEVQMGWHNLVFCFWKISIADTMDTLNVLGEDSRIMLCMIDSLIYLHLKSSLGNSKMLCKVVTHGFEIRLFDLWIVLSTSYKCMDHFEHFKRINKVK